MNAPVLEGRGLAFSFGETRVLDGVDVALAAGEIVAVMGPSGSGKSTLLHCLSGVLRPGAGEVRYDGARIDDRSDKRRSELRLRSFGFVQQFGELVPELTLLENVALPLRLTGVPHREARSRAAAILDELAVGSAAGRRAGEASGGQVQRAAVARALVHRPRVVFADEPTGSLDTATGELVMEALVGLARERGAAVLLVTHEAAVASHADREVVLRDGRTLTRAAP